MEGEVKQKILFSGDVEGQIDELYERVKQINRKNGPFDALFCVGNFFGINNKQFNTYKSGEKTIPLPTYILGPNAEEHCKLYGTVSDQDNSLCPNLYYLGKKGLFLTTKGIKIAYVSGISSDQTKLSDSIEHEYSAVDVDELYNSCIRGKPDFRGVDVLLTSQWAKDVLRSVTAEGQPHAERDSYLPAWLTMKLKPRYHFCGLEGIHREISPFRCPTLGHLDTTISLATRFIALARVANPNKHKWLFALNLTPIDRMKVSDLLVKTTDEIQCPYNIDEINEKMFKIKPKPSSNQYFYDMTENIEESKPKRMRKEKIEFDQSKCWFCLSSPSIEKHLIIAVGDFCYLAVAKGPMVDDHLLICPIEHRQHSLKLEENVRNEMEKFKTALRKYYQAHNKSAVFIERNFKTSHMQLQAIPIPQNKIDSIQSEFLDNAQSSGIELQQLEADDKLDNVLQANKTFFTVEISDLNITLYSSKLPFTFPIIFDRTVLCSKQILNVENRIDWKSCTLSREDEEALVGRIRKYFKPFDFTKTL